MVEKEQARITVRVQPNASQNDLLGFKDGVLHIRVAAPPIRSRANQELIKFLSDILGVGKSNLTIKMGITNKRKVIGISGLTQDQVMRQLERLDRQDEKHGNYDRQSRPSGYGAI